MVWMMEGLSKMEEEKYEEIKDLKQTILDNINDRLITSGKNRLYLGDFYDKVYDKEPRKKRFLFERKGHGRGISGDLSFNDKFPEVRVALEDEYLDLSFLSSGLDIRIIPYQITKGVKLEEAIEKQDWVSPPSLSIFLSGDYQEHINSIRKSAENYVLKKEHSFFIPLIC
jgi:hypothetical protein